MAVAPVIVGAVAVAASAAGTVAQLNAQKQQANAQAEASLTSALDAEERAQMAIERYGQIKQSALIQRNRELALVSSQRQAANLQVEQTLLQNKLSQLQTNLQASSIRAQGASQQLQARNQATQTKMGAQNEAFNQEAGATNQLLGRGNEVIGQLNQETGVGLQNANELSQTRAGFNQVEALTQQQAQQGTSMAELGAQQAVAGQVQDAVGQARTNSQQRRGMAEFNTAAAGKSYQIANQQLQLARKYGQSNMGLADQYANLITQMGDSQQYMSNLGADSIETNQKYTDLSVQAGASAQRRVDALQSGRNKAAIQAAYQSTLATGNMGALSQVLQEKQNIANSLAQANMAQASAPGGLSYLSAIAGGVSSAYQLGLFGRGGGGGQQQQQYQQPGMTAAGYGAQIGAQSVNQNNLASNLTFNPYLNYQNGVTTDVTNSYRGTT